MEEIRIGYRLPANIFSVIGLIIISLFFGIGSPKSWYDTDNPIYLLLPLGVFFLSLYISHALSKRSFLIINSEGLTLNYLLGKNVSFSWDEIEKVEYIEERKKKTGWEVLYKQDVDINGNPNKTCTLFIPNDRIAASNETVTKALIRGFQEYKFHKRQHEYSFEDNVIKDEQATGIVILSVVWIALNLLYFYLDHIWAPINLEPIMECTFVSGERFNTDPSLFISIPWVCVFFSILSMNFLFIKDRAEYTWPLRIFTIYSLVAMLYCLPEKQKVYLNCSEPITNPIETIEAQVTEKDFEYNRHAEGELRFKYYVDFGLTYEGKEYKFRQYEYVEDAYEGMPALIKLQKGARGLPIIQEVTIPEIGWSVNLLGEAYNEISYEYLKKGQIDKAIETIDKAIALDPNVANYYDSKGEFLFRKGDKKGALEMWIKVLSLEPDFEQRHNSYLSRQMYKQ